MSSKVACVIGLTLALVFTFGAVTPFVLDFMMNVPQKIDEELKHTTFHLDGNVTVSVRSKEYIDIRRWTYKEKQQGLPNREGLQYTPEEWSNFVKIIPCIEHRMGIHRLGEKNVVMTQEDTKIQLMALFAGVPSIKGITLTCKQWFQLINLVPEINLLM